MKERYERDQGIGYLMKLYYIIFYWRSEEPRWNISS